MGGGGLLSQNFEFFNSLAVLYRNLVSQCYIRFWTQRVTFDILSECCQDKKTKEEGKTAKRQKDGKTEILKDYKTIG